MKIHKAPLMAAVVAVTMGATACSENGTPLTAPEETSFQRQNVQQITQGTLIAALNNVNVNIQRLSLLNNLTIGDVTVVNVEDVLNNARILENARFLNNITILQDFLNNSEFLTGFLNDNQIVITDVVAINVLSGGDLVVFTR
jgi:hypothetical protein